MTFNKFFKPSDIKSALTHKKKKDNDILEQLQGLN